MAPMKPTPVKRWQYILGYLILVVAFLWSVYRIEQISSENHDVICAQKANAEKQLEATNAFIASGREIAGISKADLVATRERQEEFVKAFSDAEC